MRRKTLLLILLTIMLLPTIALASGGAGGERTHRMMVLVIQVGLIIFAAKLCNVLFEKIGLPGALGELGAGMLIGPYALGQIGFYGFSGGLFAIGDTGAISPELAALAAIAAVVLLFSAGLETDLKLLRRFAVAGGVVGLGGMVASFFGGAACVMLFSKSVLGVQLGLFAPACLFLGAVTTATSVGITARILSEKRKLESPEGVTTISAAVIDDVFGIILLAVVMSIAAASKTSGIDWGHIAIVGGKAVGVWLGATALALVASRKISILLKWFGERNSIAVLSLGLALILAGLFEEAGLAMIIGAYVMGLSLSTADIRHVIEEKLSPIYALLVPLFFCTSGMQIDLTALGSPAVLGFGLVYATVAMAAKVFGCGLPALLVKFNLRGAARIGFGMAPRCEVALIIAGVGLSAQLLSPAMFAGVVIMVVVNTVVAPPALVWLYRSDKPGTRGRVGGAMSESTMDFEFPSLQMAEYFVGKLSGVFEAEGFFVHQISREHRLYQLRKDASVIDLACHGSVLRFSCRKRDAALVNTGMYEALAALEQSVQALKEPLDSTSIRAGMQDVGALGPAELSMADYLTAGLVASDLKGESKAEIIDELLEVLDRNRLLADLAEARRAVWEREQSMSTGLQFGVAIPHGKTDAVDRLVCCVGIKRDGVDFDAMDRQPSQIFVLTLSPKSKPAPHLQFMSTISRTLNESGRQQVLDCRSDAEVHRVFTRPAKTRADDQPAKAPKPMPSRLALDDYLRVECMSPSLTATTTEGVIRELIGLLDKAGHVTDVDAAVAAVLDRESQLSTGMTDGIAIPHGRTDAVDRLACAVGIATEGANFDSVDGQPTRIVVLVLTPTGGAEPYLQLVASILGVLDENGRRLVLTADTPEALHAVLTGTEDV